MEWNRKLRQSCGKGANMIAGYMPTPECLIIEEKHNKHHCFVPPEVWGIPAETVCAVCRLKNHRLFVEAAMEVPAPAANPFSIVQPMLERICTSCGRTRLRLEFWNAGERLCGECRSKIAVICRFCGTSRAAQGVWWSKAGLCSRKECWEKYMKEEKAS